MHTFKDKTVAILGLSVEGLDSIKFFQDEGAKIWCCDRRTRQELGKTISDIEKTIQGFQLGKNYLSNLERFDFIVRTPGMSLRLPELIALRRHGKEITSSTKLFFALCHAPIIGVTGTKGKGTTSTLIAEMLKAGGKKVWLGGNVGVPLLSQVRHMSQTDTVVLELSSFQLEDLTYSPHIAVVLRTTQEHLVNQDKLATNFHETRDAYVEAKKPIVRYQVNGDIAILNADDPTSRSFAGDTPAQVQFYSRTDWTTDAYVKNQSVYLGEDKICSLSDIKLRGLHNLDNIAAAVLAARASGVSIDVIRRTVKSFKGLEHRLETVRKVGGVLYINDTFSTVPETAVAALESFTEPIILIAGGSEKGSDFTDLGKVIVKNRVKTLIAIGRMTQRIVTAAKNAGYDGKIITGLRTMHDIVTAAQREATAGDVVLLSPACASFDMFVNYKDRGYQFKHEVSLL